MTRRDLLKMAGGTALGLIFTPVPWKLLDDTAIWTQNWDLIPKLSRHPLSYRYSACTLCPAGCALRARCSGELPFALQGVAEHGGAHGILCPIGLAGHHVASNPWRLRGPVAFTSRELDATLSSTTAQDAAARVARAIRGRARGELLAVLDARPGRVLSLRYREFLAPKADTAYLTPHAGDTYTARLLGTLLDRDPVSIGVDLERADVVLSVGVPLFDGWGTPERTAGLLRRSGRTLIQAEPRRSRTASLADRWLCLRPGSEAALALGLARILLQENEGRLAAAVNAPDFRAFAELVARFTPEITAERTGLTLQDLEETARALCRARRPIILAGSDPAGGPLPREAGVALAALNILLGTPRRRGGVVLRRSLPDEQGEAARTLADLPDRSVAVLILDGADDGHRIPWELVERKLVPERSLLVSLSPYFDGLSSRADLIVPSPAHLEDIEELTQGADSPVRSFGIAPPLLASQPGSTRAVEFLRMVRDRLGEDQAPMPGYEEMLQERARVIHAASRGTLFEFARGERTPVTSLDADEFWSGLSAGARWTDDAPPEETPGPVRLLGGIPPEQVLAAAAPRDPGEILLLPTGLRGALGAGSIAPVLSKLFQESDLRDRTGFVLLNRATAGRQGVEAGERVRLRTASGSILLTVRLDESVPDAAALLPVGPSPEIVPEIERVREEDILSLCTVHTDGSWKSTTAWIERT